MTPKKENVFICSICKENEADILFLEPPQIAICLKCALKTIDSNEITLDSKEVSSGLGTQEFFDHTVPSVKSSRPC